MEDILPSVETFGYHDPMTTDRITAIQHEWRRERPDLDPAPQAVIGRLHRVAALVSTRLDTVFARFGLSDPEFDLLATLRRAGAPYERAAGELAAHTMVTAGGLTKRVDRLIARGLVERDAASDDGRRRHVRLTAAGVELIDRAIEEHLRNEKAILEEIGEADSTALEAILTRWLHLLDRQN